MDGPLAAAAKGEKDDVDGGVPPSGLRRRTEALPEQAGQGSPESPQAEHFSASGGALPTSASATASACLSAGSFAAPMRGRFVSSREGSALVSMSYFLTSPPSAERIGAGIKGALSRSTVTNTPVPAGVAAPPAGSGTDFMTVAV